MEFPEFFFQKGALWPPFAFGLYLLLSVSLVAVLREPYLLYVKNDTTRIEDRCEKNCCSILRGKVKETHLKMLRNL